MPAIVQHDARRFVATLNPDTFHQKYDRIIVSREFSALLRHEECTKADINKVSHALQDAGTPGDLLNGDDKVIDIAGHLFQMYLYRQNCHH